MDLSKLTQADKVIAGSAIALFIFYFFPWFGKSGVDGSGGDVGFLWATLPMLLGLLMLAVVAVKAFTTVELPALPITWGQALLGAGALAALLIILKLVIGYEVCVGFAGFGEECVKLDRKIGLFLSVLAAVGLAAGGFLKMQEGDDAPAAGGGGGAAPF